MPREALTADTFSWLRDVKEPITEDELPTYKTMADFTRSEQAIVCAYAQHTIKTYGRSMDQFDAECEQIAGNKQSLLAAIAHHHMSKLTADDLGLAGIQR